MLTLIIVAVIWGTIVFLQGQSEKEQRRKQQIEEEKLKRYTPFFIRNTKDIKQYLSIRDCHTIAKELLQKSSIELGEDFSSLRNKTIEWLFSLNSSYLKEEIKKYDFLLRNILGKKLDEQQKEAVLRDEDYHLIVAGAGAGKTLTIVGKVAYLCVKKKIDPSEILLISFTNKAAEEMSSRLTKQIGKNVTAYTFHKLGLEIIRKNSPFVPNIADDNVLEGIINRYYKKAITSFVTTANKLLTFLAYYLYVPVNKQKFKTLGEYIESERGTDLETLKSKYEKGKGKKERISIHGERMRSLEEVMIANFLFLNGVKYEYEKPYPYATEFAYKPDFYLPDYDIYLEHFGINKNKKCSWLPPIEAEKYLRSMEQKREIHKKNNTTLLETYSYYQWDGVLLDKLKEALLVHGVKFCPIPKKNILEEMFLRDDRGLKEFNKLLASFVRLSKAQGYTLRDFSLMEEKSPDNSYLQSRCKLFLSIVRDICKEYNEILEKTNSIDFSDMIAKATSIIKNTNYYLPYKYVIIDEYQDMGQDRYRLVKAILEKTKAKLICVGDDWQSIYRFAGSDISLFTSFEKYWGHSYISLIEKTYRNSQQLIDISGRFIMKNPDQINKKLLSDKFNSDPICKVIYLESDKQSCLEQILDNIFEKFGESTVFLLGRNSFDIEFINMNPQSNLIVKESPSEIKIEYKKHPELNIRFLTAHKSKGLEADNVVILNCDNDYLGFPNKVADDSILQLLLSKEESFQYAEERRLMYVALTRTKNLVYLLVPEKKPSEFIMELDKMGVSDAKEKNFSFSSPNRSSKGPYSCPRCKTGHLLQREHNGSNFYGCSNYPKCNYTCKNPSKYICSECGGFMLLREGKYGKFYGCSNYPLCKNTFDISSKSPHHNSYGRYFRRQKRRY